MNRPIGARLAVFLIALFVSIAFFLPSLPMARPAWWPGVLPEKGVSLGLDLQGGLYLELHVESQQAVDNSLVRDATTVYKKLGLAQKPGKPIDHQLAVTIPADKVASLDSILEESAPNLDATMEGTTLILKVKDEVVKVIKDYSVRQGLETIRNRIDEFGVSEPSIQRKGNDRIVVQLPGIKDPKRAIALIGQTAQLEFRMVDKKAPIDKILAAIDDAAKLDPEVKTNLTKAQAVAAPLLPPHTELLPVRRRDKYGVRESYMVVEDTAQLTGEYLSDASVRFDSQFNQPYVSLEFTGEGAKIFERLTGENVGNNMAIVLDNTIRSAPVIRQRIAGGRAQIDSIGTLEEARDIAVVLRAGALPAPVEIEEERTVGPTLGQDSIRTGAFSLILGSTLVMLFILVYYQVAGIIAIISLIVNLLGIVAVLGLFHATLTLPGIAGIVLTVGMAVDANIIVFERIREELRAGRTVRTSVATGFSKATWTVLDANITTLIAGLVLFQFGTGPIKGFAVTLSVGILTTLYSTLFVSRLLFDLYLQQFRANTLRI